MYKKYTKGVINFTIKDFIKCGNIIDIRNSVLLILITIPFSSAAVGTKRSINFYEKQMKNNRIPSFININ